MHKNGVRFTKRNAGSGTQTVEAQGISDYQRIVSQTLNANQLQYEMIKAYKELALSGNGKVIIMGDTKGGVPIILSDK